MYIVINSNKNFTKALEYLLQSLKKCKEYEYYNIVVVIGGHYELDSYVVTNDKNIMYIKANHNSIDFTGLITILESIHLFNCSHFFYLHDTCVVGQNFLKILNDVDTNDITTCKIKSRSSMNIGIYSTQIVKQFETFLSSVKNTDESCSELFKKKGIDFEDYIFKNDKNNKVLNNPSGEHISRSKPVDYYNTGTKRVVDYYNGIDLYKIKANWKGYCSTINL